MNKRIYNLRGCHGQLSVTPVVVLYIVVIVERLDRYFGRRFASAETGVRGKEKMKTIGIGNCFPLRLIVSLDISTGFVDIGKQLRMRTAIGSILRHADCSGNNASNCR